MPVRANNDATRPLTVTLPETVVFDYNKSDIRSDAQPALSKVATLLKHCDKAQITVLGHADNTGDASSSAVMPR